MFMRPVEIKISEFMKSRACTILMIAAGALAAFAGFSNTAPEPYTGDAGFLFASPDTWITQPEPAFIVGLLLTATIMSLMAMLNRVFNILRTPSHLFLGVFAVMQCATPLILCRLTSGLLLNIVVLSVLATFYTTYMRQRLTRRIFLSFCIIAAMSLFDYVYAVYALLFLLAFGQMRCATPRMYLAALMGLITPVWIAWGFGLTESHSLHWPQTISVFSRFDKGRLVLLVVTVGITVISGFLICASNMVKIYSYNAKARAISGLLMMLSLATALATLIDFGNAPAYLSLLNCFTAFQVGQFFLINDKRRGYILILSITLVYFIIFLCNLWI